MDAALIAAVRETVVPLTGTIRGYDPLLDSIGDAQVVLLGEASHGTHEFYSARAEITKRLIKEKGFTAVAVEADWPDAARVNRYVRGIGRDENADQALAGFDRFPTWMWRNADVLAFVDWLHAYNRRAERAAGFYGLDLYSLHRSIESVLQYLDAVDPKAAEVARQRYSCFDHFRLEPQEYGYAVHRKRLESCEDDVINTLMNLRGKSAEYQGRNRLQAEDDYFFAEQNARVVLNAEQYYRTMYKAGPASWNLRDRHMASTLEALVQHLERRDGTARVVVWAHNSHLGDARATQAGREGELNVGQLVTERYGARAFRVGFSTYSGHVTAADDWGDAPRRMRVRPALTDSYEDLFHHIGIPEFFLDFRNIGEAAGGLAEPRLERMIGVIYRPMTERWSHYMEARLPQQFDALISFDTTSAVIPLERHPAWIEEEPAETYPSTY